MTDPNFFPLQQFILDPSLTLSPTLFKSAISFPKTPTYILYILAGLSSEYNKIDPTNLLLQSISTAKTPKDLIPVALSLRYDANPNIYATLPTIGTIHIIGYTYLELYGNVQEDILNAIIIMLIRNGSNPNLNIYPDSPLSVYSWLQQENYNTILSVPLQLEPFYSTAIATLLDDIDMVQTPPILSNVIETQALSILEKYTTISAEAIDLSIDYYNTGSFLYLVKHGQLPTFWQINNLLIKLDTNDKLVKNQIFYMLQTAIMHGTMLDIYQYELLTNIDPQLAENILQIYSVPFWTKFCKMQSTNVPKRLLNYAISLDIDPFLSLSQICTLLCNYSVADPNQLVLSAQLKQKYRMASELGYIDEFIDSLPSIEFANKNSLSVDPYNVNGYDWISYRDGNGNIWCFFRSQFTILLTNKTNPITKEPLPNYVLAKICAKNSIFDGNRVSLSEAIKQLSEPDIITNKESHTLLNNFLIRASGFGLTENELNRLSAEQWQMIADQFTFPINISILPTKLAEITLFYYIEEIYGLDMDNLLFEYIIATFSF